MMKNILKYSILLLVLLVITSCIFDNTPPTIHFIYPEEGSCIWNGDTIVVVATDNEGISKINLYINDNLVKTSRKDTLKYALALISDNNCILKVRATDIHWNISVKEITAQVSYATPVFPSNNSVVPDSTPTFLWQSMCNAVSYHIQADMDSAFTSPIIDDSTLNTSYTPSYPLLLNTTYYWKFRGKNSSGVWSNWSEVVKFKVVSARYSNVLYYPFSVDSGSIAYDSSGYRNNSTIYGALWCDGISGKALSFDGVDDYVRNPSVSGFNFSQTNEMTIEAWFYLTDHSTYDGIVSVNDASGNIAYRIMVNPEMHPFYDPGSGTPDQMDTTYTFNLNTWYHYVMTVEGGDTAKIYVNGTEIYKSPDGVPTILPDGKDLLIGCGENPYRWFTAGIIDEVKIYNRVVYK